jgi:hypothetical protein
MNIGYAEEMFFSGIKIIYAYLRLSFYHFHKPRIMNRFILKSFITFHILFLCCFFVNAQDMKIEFIWGDPVTIFQEDSKKAMWFQNADYRDFPELPIYILDLGITDRFLNVEVEISEPEFIVLTQEEKSILIQSGYLPFNTIQPYVNHKFIRKTKHTEVHLLPFRINEATGEYEKLLSCQMNIDFSFSSYDANALHTKQQKTNVSVLAEGNFYRLSVSQPGIYRITAQNLAEMGINVSAVNPQHIRIFGNGGRMLPELNSESRIDDLFENAVYMHGEEDGSFDAGDYVLFYAPGPHSWSYNDVSKEYEFSVNRYNDKSYYYITVDKGPGKRIQKVDYMNETPVLTAHVFLDRSVYENETYNLIKSGKEWYGDVFDFTLSQNFSFTFPNIVADSCIKIRISMIARASGATSASVNVGSSSTVIGFTGTTGYNSDYAKPGSGFLCVNPTSNMNVGITFNKNNLNDAKAWLNKMTVNAWRNLTMSGNQMHFQHPGINEAGNYVRYNIQTALPASIWDITNPLEPKSVQANYSGTQLTSIAEGDRGREFIVYNGLSYFTPLFEGVVANQNLHGLAQTDYVIVAHSLFFEQASKLGQFHQQGHGLSYTVVTPLQIYNEFSSGSQDPTAIRDFVKMFYDRATNSDDLPKYLLLFGRASYDYKNRISDNTNFVPTFQSIESLNPARSYASDDFFGLLDQNEGFDCSGHLDIGIGRLPARTAKEADDFINKIFRYHEKTNLNDFQNTCNFIQYVPNLSDWRNWVTFISDDGNMNLHFNQSEGISANLGNNYKHLNIDKIHLDAFPQYSTPGGERAPAVNEAINRRMYQGSLIMNYTGHGGEVGWAHERILELSDINSWDNYYNMPLFITATCEFSRFDDPQRVAAGEMVLTNPAGGGIALFSTTRLAYSSFNENLNRSVYKVAFEKPGGIYPTLGEILRFAKTDNGSNEFIRNFILLGDPAMRLAYPQHKVITTSINGNPVGLGTDTISAYSFVTVEGYIADEHDNKLSGFNGVITPTVFDKPSKLSTLVSDPSDNYPATFSLQKNIIYKGKISVVNGDFSFSFFVPRDINYAYDLGKISYYAENGEIDATGYYNQFYVGGSDFNNTGDVTGPEIRLYMNDLSFRDGGTTGESPVLIAMLRDSSGINTLGSSIGHDITLVLDNSGDVIVMNDYYEADLDSYKSGRVVYPFYNLPEGLHSLYFKAWDVFNNSSESVLNFYVSHSHEAVIRKMFNNPNPFSDYTEFIFEHNQSCTPFKFTIDIFNSIGQHVTRIESEQESLGYTSEPVKWHGVSHDGNPLSSGVYIYTITLTTCEGNIAQRSNRLVYVK